MSASHVAHDIVVTQRELYLQPRDLALLVLIHDDLRQRSAPTFAVLQDDLRALSAKIDTFEAAPSGAAERRLTESLDRLIKAGCLARADMARVRDTRDAEYQLTGVGEIIADWHLTQVSFDGAPLGTVLAAFNVQLSGLHDAAMASSDKDHWGAHVIPPMQFVVRELLIAVQRHQRSLDRAHEDIRRFIPTMLTQSTETSIDQCKVVIDNVMATIRDLVQVTMDSANVGFGLLDAIQERGHVVGLQNALTACEDARRRLETIVEWTSQRHRDWGAHFETVHSHLRFVAMVDRSRRVTDALKQSVSLPPTWTLEVASGPPLSVLRERETTQQRPAIRRSRSDFQQPVETVAPDQLPERLRVLTVEHLTRGAARWSSIVEEAISERGVTTIMHRLPMIMHLLVSHGMVDDKRREKVSVHPGIVLEELEVRSD